jgi:hypothetical protein
MIYPPPRSDKWDLWIIGTLALILVAASLLVHAL